jgi:hypothetical protein
MSATGPAPAGLGRRGALSRKPGTLPRPSHDNPRGKGGFDAQLIPATARRRLAVRAIALVSLALLASLTVDVRVGIDSDNAGVAAAVELRDREPPRNRCAVAAEAGSDLPRRSLR